MEKWVRDRVDVYLRHGGKTSRRATVARLITILEDIRQHERGVRSPPQIGRAHIHRYWSRQQDQLTHRTLMDHWYATKLLWVLLERTGTPPKPSNEEKND